MTPEGRLYALMRLANAPDLNGLRAVWQALSVEYQRDEVIRDMKDAMKKIMEAG